MAWGWWTAYVIEVDDQAALGPRGDVSKPYLYVGITQKSPEDRIETHMAGGRTAASVVTKHGVQLRMDLCRQYKKANGEKAAKALEQRVTRELREQGYVVDVGKPGFFWDQFKRDGGEGHLGRSDDLGNQSESEEPT